MHHKFCVIDRATVVIGSYNWTLPAQDTDESITVIADGPDIAADYLNAFDALLSKHGLGTPAIDPSCRRVQCRAAGT
jgi:phosphatidylserine/phosphatidylglycerophosphate/cardiolipin synthase-like enzyme